MNCNLIYSPSLIEYFIGFHYSYDNISLFIVWFFNQLRGGLVFTTFFSSFSTTPSSCLYFLKLRQFNSNCGIAIIIRKDSFFAYDSIFIWLVLFDKLNSFNLLALLYTQASLFWKQLQF